MEPQEHIKELYASLHAMATDGHLNDAVVSVKAGAVQYEIDMMNKRLKEMDNEPTDSPISEGSDS